ncbi:MAG: hypothetical protein N4A33_13505 [Bacteriovoracaceae bacterium]|jgi:tRNA A37 threonylcarbamoyladenosine modification protein TsaB|nr:hypothetical protein [Bacteriovoracaceae bacterium]
MKKLLICLLALGSFSSFASSDLISIDKGTKITVKGPFVNTTGNNHTRFYQNGEYVSALDLRRDEVYCDFTVNKKDVLSASFKLEVEEKYQDNIQQDNVYYAGTTLVQPKSRDLNRSITVVRPNNNAYEKATIEDLKTCFGESKVKIKK